MNDEPRTIWQGIWQVIRTPWFGWAVAAVLLFLLLKHPRVVTITKTETKTETKVVTQWKTRIAAGPGATTVADASGHLTITGPVNITSEGNSASDTRTASSASTTVKPSDRDWSVAAGVLLPFPYFPPAPEWTLEAGKRLIGPVFVQGMVAIRSGEWPLLGASLRLEF